jgi:cyclopropane fatty-acyl-phospholipid synthase-like methyltransferase
VSEVEHFRQAYAAGGSPPWDIGHPQPAMVEAGRRGWVGGRVLDAGCGTGEHALYFAATGCEVIGVDAAPAAIARAAAKVASRAPAQPPRFVVADLLTQAVAFAERPFDTVIDMGFFHTLSDDDRSVWRAVLSTLLASDGCYVMMCFSELVPGDVGPRRLSEAEIRETFGASAGFAVADLERTELESRRESAAVAVPAWLTRIKRAQAEGGP